MGTESKIKQILNKLVDSLNDQTWFQEIKSKWEELDPKSRTYLKFASGTGVLLLIFILVIGAIVDAHQLKKELAERVELLALVQSANQELRALRQRRSGGAPQGQPANWPGYLDTVATQANLDRAKMEISPERAGPTGPVTSEAFLDVKLKHVNIKQVVRFAYHVENGLEPVKIRNLTILTDGNEGYLDASFSLSAFMVKQ